MDGRLDANSSMMPAMNMLEYKGFVAETKHDANLEMFFARAAGFADGVECMADTEEDLAIAFRVAVDDHLAGRPPKCVWRLSISPDVYCAAQAAAERAGVSLEEWVEDTLCRVAGIRALARDLGPVGMVRFFQQSEDGQGDYTKEKYELPQPSWEEIEAALQTA